MLLHMEKDDKIPNEEKRTKRHPGDRLPIGKVKNEIIKYILSQPGAVSGPDLKEYLRINFKLTDERNIRKHLKDLLNYRCIEKFEKVGYDNKWNITRIKSLQNIREHFAEIQLNEYEKSLWVLLFEYGYKKDYNLLSYDCLKFYIRLLLYPPFFDMCVETRFKSQYSNIWELYLYNRGFEKNQKTEEYINKCYSTYIESNPNSEMGRERFREIMEEVFFEIWEGRFPGWKEAPRDIDLKTIREMKENKFEILGEVLKACEARFPGWLKEIPRETYLDFIRLCNNENEDSAKKFMDESIAQICENKDIEYHLNTESYGKGVMEYVTFMETCMKICSDDIIIYNSINNALNSMKDRFFDFVLLRFDVLFEHCFSQDIYSGAALPDVKEFATNTRRSFEEYAYTSRKSGNKKEAFKKMVSSDLRQISEIIAKYKQPSIFKKFYNNSEDVYRFLEKHYINE
jgi:hypothetical protein